MSRFAPPTGPSRESALTDTAQTIKENVHRGLLQTINLVEARSMPRDQLRAECLRRIDALLTEQRMPLSAPEKLLLMREVMDEIFGLGPIEEFLRDPTVSDILVNGPHLIYVERRGQLQETTVEFRNDAQLMQVIQRIARSVGRRVDESSPMLDARLVDGSRVNAIIPPLALDGPAMSIRRFGASPIQIDRLMELNSLTPEMAQFLEGCVKGKVNILISGGTGSGKTTLLNALSKWIPETERVVTIEDAAELQLQGKHVVRLETRPPNTENHGEITQGDLLHNAVRMRPDRIVMGEVRGAEALDMLQAMNTGHEGSMTTVHANNARDALRRVENMVSMAGLNYPMTAIRQQMASALHLLVQLNRLTGGSRKILTIAEITGVEGDIVLLHDIFIFRQMGVDEKGNTKGQFEACGVRPQLMQRLAESGVDLPDELFNRRILKTTGGAASR